MGFHVAVTNGLFDWIGDAFVWLLDNILGFILPPIVWALQQILIVIPLEILDGMVKIFRFFSMGLTPYIFGTSVNPDGSVDYAFDWGSPVAKVMYTAFILAIMIFTFFYLLSFTKNHVIDETGRPTMMQSKRLVYLKWPAMMGLLLVFTPIVLVAADTLISLFISSFGNDAGKVLTDNDVYNFNNNFIDGTWKRYFDSSTTDGIKIGGTPMLEWIKSTDSSLRDIAKKMKNNTSNYYSFGILPVKINECCDTLDLMKNYLTSGIQNTDYALHGLKLTQGYLTPDQKDSIQKCIDQIYGFSHNAQYLKTQLAAIVDPNNSSFVSAWEDWDNMSGVPATSAQVHAWCDQYADSMNSATLDSGKMFYWFGNAPACITNVMLNSTITNGGRIGLYDLMSRTNGLQDFSVCPTLYTFATGDDPARWRQGPAIHFGTFDSVRFVLGVFMIFAMFMIVYTYLQATIKRLYLIVGYWIIGWFFLANGMNEPGPAKNWYKTLFGTWIGVLFLYICFEMAGVLEQLLVTPVRDGLTKYDSDASSIGLISTIGSLFCIEAAYQVMYQVANRVMTSLGTSESGAKGFAASSSMALTQGKAMAFKAGENAFSLATAKPFRDAKQSWLETKDYWADRKDKMYGREAQRWNYARNQFEFLDSEKKAQSMGYQIERPKIGDFLQKKFLGAELVSSNVKHKPGSPYFNDPKPGRFPWSKPVYFDGRPGLHNQGPGLPPQSGITYAHVVNQVSQDGPNHGIKPEMLQGKIKPKGIIPGQHPNNAHPGQAIQGMPGMPNQGANAPINGNEVFPISHDKRVPLHLRREQAQAPSPVSPLVPSPSPLAQQNYPTAPQSGPGAIPEQAAMRAKWAITPDVLNNARNEIEINKNSNQPVQQKVFPQVPEQAAMRAKGTITPNALDNAKNEIMNNKRANQAGIYESTAFPHVPEYAHKIDDNMLGQGRASLRRVEMPEVPQRPAMPIPGASAGFGKQTLMDANGNVFGPNSPLYGRKAVNPEVRPTAAISHYDAKGMPVYSDEKRAVGYSNVPSPESQHKFDQNNLRSNNPFYNTIKTDDGFINPSLPNAPVPQNLHNLGPASPEIARSASRNEEKGGKYWSPQSSFIEGIEDGKNRNEIKGYFQNIDKDKQLDTLKHFDTVMSNGNKVYSSTIATSQPSGSIANFANSAKGFSDTRHQIMSDLKTIPNLSPEVYDTIDKISHNTQKWSEHFEQARQAKSVPHENNPQIDAPHGKWQAPEPTAKSAKDHSVSGPLRPRGEANPFDTTLGEGPKNDPYKYVPVPQGYKQFPEPPRETRPSRSSNDRNNWTPETRISDTINNNLANYNNEAKQEFANLNKASQLNLIANMDNERYRNGVIGQGLIIGQAEPSPSAAYISKESVKQQKQYENWGKELQKTPGLDPEVKSALKQYTDNSVIAAKHFSQAAVAKEYPVHENYVPVENHSWDTPVKVIPEPAPAPQRVYGEEKIRDNPFRVAAPPLKTGQDYKEIAPHPKGLVDLGNEADPSRYARTPANRVGPYESEGGRSYYDHPDGLLMEIHGNKVVSRLNEVPELYSKLSDNEKIDLVKAVDKQQKSVGAVNSGIFSTRAMPSEFIPETADFVQNSFDDHIDFLDKLRQTPGLSPKVEKVIDTSEANARKWKTHIEKAKHIDEPEVEVRSWYSPDAAPAPIYQAPAPMEKPSYFIPNVYNPPAQPPKPYVLSPTNNPSYARSPVPEAMPTPVYQTPEPMEKPSHFTPDIYNPPAPPSKPYVLSPTNDPKNPVGNLQYEYILPGRTPAVLSHAESLRNDPSYARSPVPEADHHIPPQITHAQREAMRENEAPPPPVTPQRQNYIPSQSEIEAANRYVNEIRSGRAVVSPESAQKLLDKLQGKNKDNKGNK